MLGGISTSSRPFAKINQVNDSKLFSGHKGTYLESHDLHPDPSFIKLAAIPRGPSKTSYTNLTGLGETEREKEGEHSFIQTLAFQPA